MEQAGGSVQYRWPFGS